MNRELIITAAHQWVGTPYHHQACVKQVGVDCAMLIVGIARELNLIQPDAALPSYSVQWHLHNRDELLQQQLVDHNCALIENHLMQPGDILGFKFGRVTSHLGIMVSSTTFIHACREAGKVVENTLSGDWFKRWTVTYSFPGVLDV